MQFNQIKNKKIIVLAIIVIIALLIGAYFIFLNNPNGDVSNIEGPSQEEKLEKEARDFCLQNGGAVETKTRDSGEEYFSCSFGEKRECEIFEMKQGNCPIGGRLSVFSGPRDYCVSLGGQYIEKENADIEEKFVSGECVLKDKKSYNALDLYRRRNSD